MQEPIEPSAPDFVIDISEPPKDISSFSSPPPYIYDSQLLFSHLPEKNQPNQASQLANQVTTQNQSHQRVKSENIQTTLQVPPLPPNFNHSISLPIIYPTITASDREDEVARVMIKMQIEPSFEIKNSWKDWKPKLWRTKPRWKERCIRIDEEGMLEVFKVDKVWDDEWENVKITLKLWF